MQNTIIYSTLIECLLYANVELLMILVEVPHADMYWPDG